MLLNFDEYQTIETECVCVVCAFVCVCVCVCVGSTSDVRGALPLHCVCISLCTGYTAYSSIPFWVNAFFCIVKLWFVHSVLKAFCVCVGLGWLPTDLGFWGLRFCSVVQKVTSRPI